MTEGQLPPGPGRAISQRRSRKTYEAFIATGFKLLRQHEFESITIAQIAKAAGYSVGAFYARFQSKDEFFEAMVAHHIRERATAREHLLKTVSREEFVAAMVDDLVKYYWRRRRFWRAALMRSAHDPDFFAPISQVGREFVGQMTARIESDAGRSLTESEVENVEFAIHMLLSMINNRIVNRPKPSLIGQSTFVENLTRAFRLVSNYEQLTARNT